MIRGVRRTWRDGINANPNAVDLKFNLANLLGEIGRTEEAESLFVETLEIAPDSAKLYLQYGRLLISQGKPEKASVIYHQGLAKSPDDGALTLALSEISSKN
jgi:tetratricopeptide (TPR) repeat protein